MKLLRKGTPSQEGDKIHEYANDWIMAEPVEGGTSVTVRPDRAQLEGDEYWRMREAYSRWLSDPDGSRHVGSFWREWELQTDGTGRCAPRPGQVERGSRRGGNP